MQLLIFVSLKQMQLMVSNQSIRLGGNPRHWTITDAPTVFCPTLPVLHVDISSEKKYILPLPLITYADGISKILKPLKDGILTLFLGCVIHPSSTLCNYFSFRCRFFLLIVFLRRQNIYKGWNKLLLHCSP